MYNYQYMNPVLSIPFSEIFGISKEFCIPGIYKITNVETKKFYIGSSNIVKRRAKEHHKKLISGTHSNPFFQNAFIKYGIENFIFEILELCSYEDLIVREQYWLDETKCYDSLIGYNICCKADSPRDPSEATRKKMSESGKKRPPKSEETRRRLSESLKGKTISEAHKLIVGDNIRECWKNSEYRAKWLVTRRKQLDEPNSPMLQRLRENAAKGYLGKRPIISEEILINICSDYRSGLDIIPISKKYEISKSLVSAIFQKHKKLNDDYMPMYKPFLVKIGFTGTSITDLRK